MTRRVSVLNHTTALDSGVYFSKLTSEMTLTNAKQQLCIVIPDPSADIGLEVVFEVPQDYSSSPVLVIKGVLDGTPANVLAFGAQLLQRADSDAIDTAYEAEDTASNSTWTGYADEDFYEETITPASEMNVVLSPSDLPYELSNNHLILLLEATYSSAYGTLSVAREIEVTVKQRRN